MRNPLGPRPCRTAVPHVRPNGLPGPRVADGGTGAVPYNGGRKGTCDSLTLTTADHSPTAFRDPADPADGVLAPTIDGPGPVRAPREPAYARTLGRVPDVFDLGTGLTQSGDQPTFRLVSQRDAAWAGALLAVVDVQ
ncbi:hypothetical protein ACFWIJ_20570 [Streptomyces sp. NPDC127079]|uniref:hypothetical protein n=1 Tax=Streptomyces sp. NPDC127079 TaxID=3347132 RepID=UPI0036622250